MRFLRLVLPATLLLLGFSAQAKVFEVSGNAEFLSALEQAEKGDEIFLRAGEYAGNFTVSRPILLRGEEKAVLDAKGEGSALTLAHSGIKVEGLEIKNWGANLYEWNSGILISEGSDDVRISNVKLEGPGFGIRGDHIKNLTVTGCEIRGKKKIHVLDRGDGIFLKYVDGAELSGNKVIYTRDGFYFEDSKHIKSFKNSFAGLQYGIHFMYDKDDEAFENKAVAVRGGYAIMNSDRITLYDNTSSKTIEFGILMNVTEGSSVFRNRIEKAVNPRGRPELDTQGKALFIYGPGKNSVYGNTFSESDIGVSVSMGGEGTLLWNNSFLDNTLQVRYVGTKGVEWSKDGRGNYWSSYQGWDLNKDGVGDAPFQPNDSLDRLFFLFPEARFLMDSPVVILLKFLAAQFAFDRGVGVTDSFPLMTPPEKA